MISLSTAGTENPYADRLLMNVEHLLRLFYHNQQIHNYISQQYLFIWYIHLYVSTVVAHCLRCCATNRKVAGSVPAGVIGIFHWHKILPIALLRLEQKWVPGAFPADKGGRCVRLTTLPPSCGVVMKSGKLNFLEPSWPLQACNGTALPFICFNISMSSSVSCTFVPCKVI